jgi:hypothetical protein
MDIWRDGDFATSIDTVGWRSVALDTVSSSDAAAWMASRPVASGSRNHADVFLSTVVRVEFRP